MTIFEYKAKRDKIMGGLDAELLAAPSGRKRGEAYTIARKKLVALDREFEGQFSTPPR